MSEWHSQRGVLIRLSLAAVLVLVLAFIVVGEDPADPSTTDRATETGAGNDPTTSGEEPTPAVDLLPNVRILDASNISIEAEGARRLLRFDAVLANVGAGPLEIVPRDLPSCPRGQRHVAQAVYQDSDGNGRYDRKLDRRRTTRSAGCVLFHRTHGHWHFDATARYALYAEGSDAAVVDHDKVSFCLRDNERLPGVAGRRLARHYGECARDRRQGITTGWSDRYDAALDGQALPLPRSLPDGVYCLRLQADPSDLLRETDEDDNGSTRSILITGTRLTAAEAPRCSTA